jgi:DNA topoisomerase-1
VRPVSTNGGGARGRGGAPNLVIVESPAKARTVENLLGPGYRVIASVGHVRDLPNYGYGLEDFETFRPKYVVVKDRAKGVDKSEVVRDIAQAASTAERVYLSTDPDREGEAIAWHIREAAGIPEEKTSRVVFHEVTRPAIEEAFRHPGKINMDLVEAQQTRRVVDRLMGFPLTWFVQDKVSRSASAGRVQSVALRLIVEREREIQGFVPQQYWTIHALLAKGAEQFTADLVRLPGQRGKPTIASGDDANRLIDVFIRSAFVVDRVKKGQRSRSPAPPFTTSTFQQAANNRLNMGAARAMQVAQQLYEGVALPGEGPVGLITYMRTDSLSISPLARQEARSYVSRAFGPEYVPEKERVYRTRSRGAQEAHEAIRPTAAGRTPESLRDVLDRDQLRVYTLIWQRFMASQMADARYDTVTVDMEARENGQTRGIFRASSQQLVFPGHLRVYGRHETDADEENEDGQQARLPELADGEQVERRNVEGKQHFTEPPPRYTEASLVKALEEEGIGRPSTYATIVQTVQKRDYVKKEGRALVPQELGFLVNDLLVQYFDQYVAVPFTSNLEEQLDEVAEGERGYEEVARHFWETFKEQVDAAKAAAPKQQEETGILCDVCRQANMVVKWGRNGKFLACPRFPDCKNTMQLNAEGEPVRIAAPEPIDYHCPKCGSQLLQKTGPYGPYVDCAQRESGACDFRAGVPVGVPCPEEPESGQLVEKKSRRGTFYGCWNYPNCSYTTTSLDPGKMAPVRPPAERAEANRKLLERSARGKAAFAARRQRARAS